jgi:hypothetical protein
MGNQSSVSQQLNKPLFLSEIGIGLALGVNGCPFSAISDKQDIHFRFS